MNRRSLFRRLGAAVAVVAVAPALSVQAEPVPDEKAKAEQLMERMLAEPDKHPDLWAMVRALEGSEPSLRLPQLGGLGGLQMPTGSVSLVSNLTVTGNTVVNLGFTPKYVALIPVDDDA